MRLRGGVSAYSTPLKSADCRHNSHLGHRQTSWDSTPRDVTPSRHVHQQRNTYLGRSPCRMLTASHLLRDSAWRCHGWRASWAWARRHLHKCEHRLPSDSHSKGDALAMYHKEQHQQNTVVCVAPPVAAAHPTQQRQCQTRAGCWGPRGHRRPTRHAAHPETCIADRSVVKYCCKGVDYHNCDSHVLYQELCRSACSWRIHTWRALPLPRPA